jgi:putative oxidoreductase
MTGNESTLGKSPGRRLHVALWIAQVALAAVFGIGGVMKITMPIAELARKLVWPGALPPQLIRFIGTVELAAAFGLVLPAATRIRPGLTPLAGAGLVAVMVLAMFFHLSRGELLALPINLVLGGLAAFVAWGRSRRLPIAPRA